ncbi:neurogenic locus Notch protein-like isoform X1 [Dreissena polymorpha]|uniref:neurogenic locus Notch protein-like isoform X1 n=1 Tax=Dreissena polymorpha TaxID=45954 RepID=UPI0022652BD4|nr:neurogenic locus Notch protein-like isoform X1 [Dreissena polymorpha]
MIVTCFINFCILVAVAWSKQDCGRPPQSRGVTFHIGDSADPAFNDKPTFPHGQRIQYRCREGFHTASYRGFMIECNDGTWTNLTLQCEVLVKTHQGQTRQPQSCQSIANGRIIDDTVVCNDGFSLHVERRQCTCNRVDGSLKCNDVTMACKQEQNKCVVPESPGYTYMSLDGGRELRKGATVPSGTRIRVVCQSRGNAVNGDILAEVDGQDDVIQCVDGVFADHNLKCGKDGCQVPSVFHPQLSVYDISSQRKYVSGSSLYIRQNDSLVFNCESFGDTVYEPHRRLFACDHGSWVVQQRPTDEPWSFENNGSFPICRQVNCPSGHCKFGGHCNRDFECECPAQTVGRNCEKPMCLQKCENGGLCVAPNTCQCSDGFQGRNCEQATATKQCTSIANGKITDRGRSVECDSNYSLVFISGMDASLYMRYSCTCDKTSGTFSCLGSNVACKPNGCPIPSYLQQGFTLYDYTSRQYISWANRYEIPSGDVLNFNCEPSNDVYYEPRQRMFACDKGFWVGKQKSGEESWSFENNGTFPACRPVICPGNYCMFGGHCIRDFQCQCPQHTTGQHCEQALCGDGCLHGGSCSAPNKCTCPDGYEGPHCQQASCRGGCLHGGSCIAPDTCRCPNGYEGTSCQQAVCRGGCLHGGSCIAPDTCKCPYGYAGTRCQQVIDSCTIANGKITDRGKSVECDTNHTLVFSNEMDSSLYSRYSCKCATTSGTFSCLGSSVACKPNACHLPSTIEQGMTILDLPNRRTITGSTHSEIKHGQSLMFHCQPNGANFNEPHQRVFLCDKGSWIARQRNDVERWSLGNNGAFPTCRPVKCPAGYCENGGYCKQDFTCECPDGTTGGRCEVKDDYYLYEHNEPDYVYSP